MSEKNPMQAVRLEKVTLNIGAGEGGEALQNAKSLLEKLTGKKAVITEARARNPSFKIKQGDPIGVKITLRGKDAVDFVSKALESKDKILDPKSFDKFGNVSFGVKEYIDFPGAKYDPKLGMLGFDVCLTLYKPGKRIGRRKVRRSRAGRRQLVAPQEARDFMVDKFSVALESAEKGE